MIVQIRKFGDLDTHKGKSKWNSLVYAELQRRSLVRKAKEFHKKRMADREAGILEVRNLHKLSLKPGLQTGLSFLPGKRF